MKRLEEEKRDNWKRYRSNRRSDYNNNYNCDDNNCYSNNCNNNYSNNNNSGYLRKHHGSSSKTILFSSRQVVFNGFERKSEVLFSDANIDLSTIAIPLENRKLRINIVFSNGKIKINEDIPTVIRVKSVFSSVSFPNNSNISFGDYDYVTRSFREGMPHLYIRIDSVFSSTQITSL